MRSEGDREGMLGRDAPVPLLIMQQVILKGTEASSGGISREDSCIFDSGTDNPRRSISLTCPSLPLLHPSQPGQGKVREYENIGFV